MMWPLPHFTIVFQQSHITNKVMKTEELETRRRVGHMVLGQRDKPVKNVCCLGMWPTLAPLPLTITSKASHRGFKFSKPEWWHTCFSTHNTLLSLQLRGKRGM